MLLNIKIELRRKITIIMLLSITLNISLCCFDRSIASLDRRSGLFIGEVVCLKIPLAVISSNESIRLTTYSLVIGLY